MLRKVTGRRGPAEQFLDSCAAQAGARAAQRVTKAGAAGTGAAIRRMRVCPKWHGRYKSGQARTPCAHPRPQDAGDKPMPRSKFGPTLVSLAAAAFTAAPALAQQNIEKLKRR